MELVIGSCWGRETGKVMSAATLLFLEDLVDGDGDRDKEESFCEKKEYGK